MDALVFPGQGAQYVGMRAALGPLSPRQRALFEEADDTLGEALTAVIDAGPPAALTRTSNAQPALLVVGLAWAEALRARGFAAGLTMGHSLGEYTALVWAGALGFADAVRTVRRRGALMEQAVHTTPGTMAAIVRVPDDVLQAIVAECRAVGVVEVTNFNAPGQVVVSGERAAVAAVVARVEAAGVGRAAPLDVAAPFHSSLLAPMASDFAAHLAGVPLRAPRLVFVDNVTGAPEADPARIRAKLVRQLTCPVRWEDGVRAAIAAGVTRFVEAGPGAVLTGLVRRIDRSARAEAAERGGGAAG